MNYHRKNNQFHSFSYASSPTNILIICLFITAPAIENVQKAVEYIFPLVHEYKKDKPAQLRNCRTVEFLKQENGGNGLNDEQLCHKVNAEAKK